MNQTVNVTYEPEVVVDTADLSREDWLAYRRLCLLYTSDAADD